MPPPLLALLGLEPLRLCERLLVFREYCFIWANRPCFKAFSEDRALLCTGRTGLCPLAFWGRYTSARCGDAPQEKRESVRVIYADS